MFKSLFIILSCTSIFIPPLRAQVNSLQITKDSLARNTFVPKTGLEVKLRNYFMNTINANNLKDDYALASGVSLGFLSRNYHGFQSGISATAIYNVYSSDLLKPDQNTLASNRYEIGLFDLQHPYKKVNLFRFENLFISYTFSKNTLTIGRMKLNTPFLNQQDGRMNVTMEEGIWFRSAPSKNLEIETGWIWKISPRSSTQWFSVSQSIGINPVGINEQGLKSGYAGQLSSKGLALLGAHYELNKHMKLNVWDLFIENILNTAMLEIHIERGNDLKFYQGLMYIRQDALATGGNTDPLKSYVSPGAQSNVISGQSGLKTKRFNTSLNYTHITGDGRFLLPREWGREPLYTLMFRERNEGSGKLYAINIKTYFYSINGRLKTGGGYGYYLLPDVKDYRLNKYGLPSYHHINFEISYNFAKFLKGLEVRSISVCKINNGETYNDLKYIYNKVNMFNFSLILDYKF